MKTKEFIKTLQDKNYKVRIGCNNEICVSLEDCSYVAGVSGEYKDVFTIGYNISQIKNESERTWLVDLISSFAKTPIDERGDEKKYHLKHRWLLDKGLSYLCYDKLSYLYFLSIEPLVSDEVTSEFTQEHIDSIKRKFNTTLDGFKMIEVE